MLNRTYYLNKAIHSRENPINRKVWGVKRTDKPLRLGALETSSAKGYPEDVGGVN